MTAMSFLNDLSCNYLQTTNHQAIRLQRIAVIACSLVFVTICACLNAVRVRTRATCAAGIRTMTASVSRVSFATCAVGRVAFSTRSVAEAGSMVCANAYLRRPPLPCEANYCQQQCEAHAVALAQACSPPPERKSRRGSFGRKH